VWIRDALRKRPTQNSQGGPMITVAGWRQRITAMVSYDALLASPSWRTTPGFGGDLFHPKEKQVMEWLAKLSQRRPDSRYGGFRHLPPIAHLPD